MSFSNTITYTWNDGSTTLSSPISASGNSVFNMDVSVAGSGSAPNPVEKDIEVELALADIVAFYITSNVTVTFDLAAQTLDGTSSNDSSVSGGGVTIAGGTPFQWISGNNYTNPITGDFTVAKITNALGTGITANVKIRILLNKAVNNGTP